MTVVNVHELTVAVGDRQLVSAVSVALAAGEITALVGESGSGKTTAALSLLGEWPSGAQVTGTIEIDGSTVDAENPPAAGTVGYIPQQPSGALNPVRRIGSVLREIARLHVRADTRAERAEQVEQRVHDALRQAQIPADEGFLRRYPHQLSGGQQQRLVLAQVLIGRPRVLLADEPTTGQDTVIRGQLIDELHSLAEQGFAVLLLSHDLDLVRALADHVLVMRHGMVVESGNCREVFAAPEHPYTRRLVEAQPAPAHRDSRHVPDNAPLLRADELVAGHRGIRGQVSTLRGVSLQLHAGETLAVVGRSGSGKTTLARCLAGLHKVQSGLILLDGAALPALVRQRSRQQVARIQYVFQDARASFSEFTPVLDQVARTAEKLHGLSRVDARERAVAELARLGIPSASAARKPHALSLGELQRAALVRAMLAEPDLLICDEITSGLDTARQAELVDVLASLQQETGCALMVITHDLAVVGGLADRVLILAGGQVVEQGRTAEVLECPTHPETQALVAAAEKVGTQLVTPA